jgi:hypothetical protein
LGEVAINSLVRDLRGSVTQVSRLESAVEIEDMPESFLLSRQHVMMLCDAALSKTLASEDLTTVEFALMVSDHFGAMAQSSITKKSTRLNLESRLRKLPSALASARSRNSAAARV